MGSGSLHSTPALSCCLLAGGMERLYPFCCQIEKGQGLGEDDPDPQLVLPSLWHGGRPVCLCNHACTVVCVCVSVFQVCVLVFLLLGSPPWVASLLQACLLGIRQGF